MAAAGVQAACCKTGACNQKVLPSPNTLVAPSVPPINAISCLHSASLEALWPGADGNVLSRSILLDLRLPRALTAFGTGAVLALAGLLMQALLRNPLADPYVLGVSGGAAVAALGAMVLGLSGLWIDLGAAVGALCAMLTVFARA